MGTGSFLGVNRQGGGVDSVTPSSTEVKEREELYIYTHLGFCGLCYKLTFTFTYNYSSKITNELKHPACVLKL
jgi:hypothetical protein